MEAMIASTVLAVAVVGISGLLSSSYAQSTGQDARATALLLARQLMEEISAHPVALAGGAPSKPGWNSGENDRRKYDTVDDYNGYTDQSNGLKSLADRSISIGEGKVFTRSVFVTSGVRPSGHTVAPGGDFMVVRVTVSAPDVKPVVITRFFANVGLAR